MNRKSSVLAMALVFGVSPTASGAAGEGDCAALPDPCLVTIPKDPPKGEGTRVTTWGELSLGTVIRADTRDGKFIPPANGTRIGIRGEGLGGSNSDDSNLNYNRGDAVSTPLAANFGAHVRRDALGASANVTAWRDYAQIRGNVVHGHVPNGYAANSRLSDREFGRFAQFSGIEPTYAYAYYQSEEKRPLTARLGLQTIDWAIRSSIAGGLEQINPVDYSRTPIGDSPERLGIPAAYVRWGAETKHHVEAFYQFRSRHSQQPGCGTFFAFLDYAAEGCDKALAAPPMFNDREALDLGAFGKRAADRNASDGGEYGVGAAYRAKKFLLSAYFANYHSRRFATSVIKSTRVGAPLVPGDPENRNVQYFLEYPENVRVWGLTLQSAKKGEGGVLVEYTYQPNQIILLNAADLFNAFATGGATAQPTLLRRDADATAPGDVYHGYDRRRISQLNSVAFYNIPGGRYFVAGEVGLKYIHDLPDVDVRRYGRMEAAGIGPVPGAPCMGPARQCTTDGYVSAFSWGYRIKAAARFHPGGGIVISPSLAFAHDVKGYYYEAILNEGRRVAIAALRADFARHYFMEAKWASVSGGDYNLHKDRDVYALTVGARF